MVKVVNSSLNILNMQTRIPFKYGIATLRALPHLFVSLDVDVDGKIYKGLAADGLAPKWFTKNPDSSFEEDIDEMLRVIQKAVEISIETPASENAFKLWLDLHMKLREWGYEEKLAPLLTSFGASMVERAVINAVCEAVGKPFHKALFEDDLGFELKELHPQLGLDHKDILKHQPLEELLVRHTVGLADPILPEEIEELTDDNLPHSLQECLSVYGLKRLKIKLSGKLQNDKDRLLRIYSLTKSIEDFKFTADGNEFFKSVAEFKDYWESMISDDSLQAMFRNLLFVEQPFARDIALVKETRDELISWKDRPKIIIDESDTELHAALAAISSGYRGTSHKNCKGIFKSVANACLIKEIGGVMSAEDLCNVGPVALLQDLAVVSTLGIDHVERNGHHYMKGLSMFSDSIQKEVLQVHGDLYKTVEDNASLKIVDGKVNLKSVNKAFLGCGITLDTEKFTPVSEWKYESLSLERE